MKELYNCLQCRAKFKGGHENNANKFCSRKCYYISLKKGGISNNKMTATNLERYGTEIPCHCEKYKNEMIERSMEKNGVPWQISSTKTRENSAKTNIERYGYSSFVMTGIPTEAVKNSVIQSKRLETLKKRGLLLQSNVETDCYKIISSIFQNVTRHVMVNHWSIDMCIEDIDTYVQFDGNFWHGIGRNIEEVSKSIKPVDKGIAKKMIRDLEQVKWFENKNMKLVRIIESDFNKSIDKNTFIRNLFHV